MDWSKLTLELILYAALFSIVATLLLPSAFGFTEWAIMPAIWKVLTTWGWWTLPALYIFGLIVGYIAFIPAPLFLYATTGTAVETGGVWQVYAIFWTVYFFALSIWHFFELWQLKKWDAEMEQYRGNGIKFDPEMFHDVLAKMPDDPMFWMSE